MSKEIYQFGKVLSIQELEERHEMTSVAYDDYYSDGKSSCNPRCGNECP